MSLDQIAIRRAGPKDACGIAAVHDDAWRYAYRGIIPGVMLERMVERRGPQWWARLIRSRARILVLDHADKPVGYVTLGSNRSHSLRVRGEVYELYIAPEYQGLGFGKELFSAARRELEADHMGHFVTWALEDNEPAIAFYKAMGGEAVAHGVERFAGTKCRKLAFVWGDRKRR